MGFLRFLLALSVMIQHGGRFTVPSFRLVAADMAVYLFFIISGYYMAMTLERNYLGRAGGIARFYANRVMRLYPLYLVSIAGALLLFMIDRDFFTRVSYLRGFPALADPMLGNLPFRVSADLANLSIVGSDLLRLSTIFSTQLQINPPAWSLATELCFYAIAPLLILHIRRPAILAALTCLTAALSWGLTADYPTTEHKRIWFDTLAGSAPSTSCSGTSFILFMCYTGRSSFS